MNNGKIILAANTLINYSTSLALMPVNSIRHLSFPESGRETLDNEII
jgi:hypothetical protein